MLIITFYAMQLKCHSVRLPIIREWLILLHICKLALMHSLIVDFNLKSLQYSKWKKAEIKLFTSMDIFIHTCDTKTPKCVHWLLWWWDYR